MKNIHFYFGYNGSSKYDKFTYWLCNTLTFIPSLEIDLFRKSKTGNSKLTHNIYVGFLKYYWRWYKFQNKPWRFQNLSN